MKKIFYGIVIGVVLLSTICFADEVVSVQSRPDRARLINKTVDDFFLMIRNMEYSGKVLGLSAAINQTNGVEIGTPNNIDAHMVKNTEYGAAAILAVSQYGYREKVPTIMGNYDSSIVTLGDSTTGEVGTASYYYGLFDMANIGRYTETASMDTSGYTQTYRSIFYDAVHGNTDLSKYVDSYPNPSTTNPIAGVYYGDATRETSNWRSAGEARWTGPDFPIFSRRAGMFGYRYDLGSGSSTRAVVVCGEGI